MENLPGICVYDIAVLKDAVEVTVEDEKGNPLKLAEGESVHEFLEMPKGLDAVPAEVAAQVDVLKVAQTWSLFTSADVPFKEAAKYIVSDSYQYKVATQYATGVDISFISAHTLLDPAFTGNTVSNFTWINDNCFSVDVSFVKHMHLTRTGAKQDDPMNDRFYYIKIDDTKDGVDNPTWKIVGMKEIVGAKEGENHAE